MVEGSYIDVYISWYCNSYILSVPSTLFRIYIIIVVDICRYHNIFSGWEGRLENEQIRIHLPVKAVAMAVGSFAGYSAMRALREAGFFSHAGFTIQKKGVRRKWRLPGPTHKVTLRQPAT